MTDHVARLYAVALAIVVFSLTWAVVAAKPWAHEEEKDPRLAVLERRELRLRRESVRVQRLVQRRFAAYRVELRARQREIAAVNAANAARAAAAASAASAAPVTSAPAASAPAASAPAAPPPPPAVSVVSVPPVTATRSS